MESLGSESVTVHLKWEARSPPCSRRQWGARHKGSYSSGSYKRYPVCGLQKVREAERERSGIQKLWGSRGLVVNKKAGTVPWRQDRTQQRIQREEREKEPRCGKLVSNLTNKILSFDLDFIFLISQASKHLIQRGILVKRIPWRMSGSSFGEARFPPHCLRPFPD